MNLFVNHIPENWEPDNFNEWQEMIQKTALEIKGLNN